MTAAYLQRNLRPQVRSITVHPPGIVFQKPFSTGDPDLAGFDDQIDARAQAGCAGRARRPAGSSPSLGRRTYQKGLQTLVWRADDENDDELVYDVQYRREGESAWKTLRKAVTETILVWDTTTVPNGTYFVKIVASDAPSNSGSGCPDRRTRQRRVRNRQHAAGRSPSARFAVERGRTIITFDVKDDHSPIQRVEFSQDGQQLARRVSARRHRRLAAASTTSWPIDGELGERGLTLRATDSMNNVATTQVDARPPRRSGARRRSQARTARAIAD